MGELVNKTDGREAQDTVTSTGGIDLWLGFVEYMWSLIYIVGVEISMFSKLSKRTFNLFRTTQLVIFFSVIPIQ